MEQYETEEVKIGNWQSRLPSDICTNRQVFDEIFSLDTWNNVLIQEQKQRLIQMLPKEVSSSEDATKQTIEEFFNGSLSLFSKNPLGIFFEKLETGQYDPVVTDMKANIKRELKKESLRQLKNYHTRLLEDIVVSRQRHLSRLKAKILPLSNNNSKAKSVKGKNSKNTVKKQPGVLQNASSELNTKLSASGKPKSQAVQKPVIANTEENNRESHTTLNPVSKKRKGKDDSLDTVDAGKPAAKKPAYNKPKPAVALAEKRGGSIKISDGKSESKKETTLVIGKAENISPSIPHHQDKPLIVVTTPQPRFVIQPATESILNAALTGDKVSKSSSFVGSASLSSSSATYTSPSKSSPILASQLQASPQVSVKIDDSLGFFNNEPESESSCRITLNYQKMEEKSSDDDLETSSDEFEAIQPTIGFGTSLPVASTMTGILSPASTLSKVMLSSTGNTLQAISASGTITTSTPFTSRIIQVHPQQQQDGNSSFVAVTVSSANSKLSTSNPMYIVSTTGLDGQQQHGRLLQLSKDPMKLPVTSQHLAIMNSSKILVKGNNHNTDQQFLQKLTGHSQELIRLSNSDLLNAKASGGGVHYVSTSTGKNLLLHPLNTNAPSTLVKTTHQIVQQDIPVSYSSLNLSSNSVQFVTSGSQQQLKANDSLTSLNSSSLLDNDELNLSLGSLGSLGLGLGMNVSGISNISVGSLDGIMDSDNMKLEMDAIDKIDDLSVLDGNPFDSIPNLSDELDGLDLDLVDGLCDFEGLLSDEKKYPSFFSLIRDVLCSTRDHRMNLMCLEKTVKKWTTSPGATLNSWFLRVADWNNALMTALNFLAGTYQDVHPEDFVPYIEYKYKTKYYQWIGAGRDGDNNLTPLCSIWMDNMDRLPSIKKLDGETEDQEEEDEENEDSELTGEEAKKKNKRPITPPPPRCVTDWTVQPSSEEERTLFRKQERTRFDNPHKAFTYNMHGYESVVGPVKGVYSSQVGMTNKARGHSLLVDDRPPYVTILALVRDAVARLPNGEGTRSEICEMLRDSAFLAPDASSVTLNSVVSGALDRLHYERDPCVRYDSHKKSWIYLHRDRTQEQFERLHHNRSYTKSTKNRNNNSRKSRRATAKSQNAGIGSSAASSTSSSTTTLENSCAEDDQIALMPSVTVGSLSPGSGTETISQTLSTQTQSNSSESNTVTLPSNIPTTATDSEIPAAKLETDDSVPPSTKSLQNINFATELQEVTSAPTVNIVTTSESPPQYLIQTSAASLLSALSQNTIQLHSAKPLQVQSLNTSAASVETVSSVQRPVSTTVATSQGQMVFGPQTMLRLANALRLGQIRLPGSAISGNTRLPQHRILLTRGAVPGQGQTQGILLGQTATGQTVILSTQPPGSIGSFQTLQSMATTSGGQVHHDSSIVQSVSSSLGVDTITSLSQASPITTYSLKPMVSKPSVFSAVATSNPCGGAVFDANSPKMIQLNIAGGTGIIKQAVTSSSGSQPGVISVSIPSQTEYVTTSTATLAGLQPQLQRHPLGYTIATVRGNTMSHQTGQVSAINRTISGPGIQLQSFGQSQLVGSALGQQQHQTIVASTGTSQQAEYSEQNTINVSQNQTAMTSPIIIRSVQGDFMLPGHIALGKGVQGIKLIPFPMGNKTVLAKILPPNTTPRMATAVTTISTPVTTSTFSPATTSSSGPSSEAQQ